MSVYTIKTIYKAILTFQTEMIFIDNEKATILRSNKCTDERVENCKEWAIENGKDTGDGNEKFPNEYYDIITIGQYSAFIF